MKLADGGEVLCTLALPLPLTLVGERGQAIADAAERAGYADCVLMTDGTNRVVARRGATDGEVAPVVEPRQAVQEPSSVDPSPITPPRPVAPAGGALRTEHGASRPDGSGSDSPHTVAEADPSAIHPPETPESPDGPSGAQSGPAERLRSAADLIERAAAETARAPINPWSGLARGHLVPWVALMSPDLAAPLAALLRDEAISWHSIAHLIDPGETMRSHALSLADAILGGEGW